MTTTKKLFSVHTFPAHVPSFVIAQIQKYFPSAGRCVGQLETKKEQVYLFSCIPFVASLIAQSGYKVMAV